MTGIRKTRGTVGPRGLRLVERALLAIAAGALLYCASAFVEAVTLQWLDGREIDAGPPRVEEPAGATAPGARPGDVVGRLEIPRVGVLAIVRTGVDPRTLRLGAGLIPGSGWPGETGNVGVAGHRDTWFRGLRSIAVGDTVQLVTPGHVYRYRVERTQVVSPRDVWVLAPTSRPTLTLVTCYPFTWLGHASERFVVWASLVT